MIEAILRLLELFDGRVPDSETRNWVRGTAGHKENWRKAHDVFDKVRRRKLAAIRNHDATREMQYHFEEVCLKSIYNESGYPAPFDSDSPYWIFPLALALAASRWN